MYLLTYNDVLSPCKSNSRLRPEMERAIEAIQEMAPGDGLARVVLVGAPDVHQARAFAAADEQILLRLGSSKAQGANHPRMPLFERTHSYLYVLMGSNESMVIRS